MPFQPFVTVIRHIGPADDRVNRLAPRSAAPLVELLKAVTRVGRGAKPATFGRPGVEPASTSDGAGTAFLAALGDRAWIGGVTAAGGFPNGVHPWYIRAAHSDGPGVHGG
jgi:hypothetical protein